MYIDLTYRKLVFLLFNNFFQSNFFGFTFPPYLSMYVCIYINAYCCIWVYYMMCNFNFNSIRNQKKKYFKFIVCFLQYSGFKKVKVAYSAAVTSTMFVKSDLLLLCIYDHLPKAIRVLWQIVYHRYKVLSSLIYIFYIKYIAKAKK